MEHENMNDEYDIVVFEDDRLKFVKEVDFESDDEVEELDDEFVTSRYEDILTVYEMMKEHFMYSEVKYFDKVTLSHFNDYFNDTQFDISHGLEIDQEIPDFPIISVKIRKPNIYEWIGMHYDILKMSYSYMKRLCRGRGLPNNSFEIFCTMGYETSTL